MATILVHCRVSAARPGLRGLAALAAEASTAIGAMETALDRVARAEGAPEFNPLRAHPPSDAAEPQAGPATVQAAFEDAKTQWRAWAGILMHSALCSAGLSALPVGFIPKDPAETGLAEAHAAQCARAKTLRCALTDIHSMRQAPNWDPALAEGLSDDPRDQALLGWVRGRFACDAWATDLVRQARNRAEQAAAEAQAAFRARVAAA